MRTQLAKAEVSADIRAVGESLLDIFHCSSIEDQMGPEAPYVATEMHEKAKRIVKNASAIVDPVYNPLALKAAAWYIVCEVHHGLFNPPTGDDQSS